MRKLFILGIMFLGLTGLADGQSGRRVKTPATPPPVAASSADSADTTAQAAEQNSVGYSESAPNRARSISIPRGGSNKKPKKDSKATTQPVATANPAATATAAAGDEEVVKVETNLITIPVSVNDRNGNYIPNLQQKNFKVFEDGKEQEVAYFGRSDNPFTVVLLIDVSPSTEYKIEQIQDAAYAFVEQLEPQDSVTVISFDSSVHVQIERSNDHAKIRQAIRKTNFGDGTSLYEAVDTALRKQLEKIEGRKAVVLFTDGVDTTSRGASYERTVREAEESEAVIFPIYFNTYLQNMGIGGSSGGVMSTPPIISLPGNSGMGNAIKDAYALGRAYLEDLAASTGGRVYRPESTPGGLNSAFEGIADELRRQYSIGYYPQEEGELGQRKQIKVRIDRPNLVIRSRDSYIVGENNQPQTTK